MASISCRSEPSCYYYRLIVVTVPNQLAVIPGPTLPVQRGTLVKTGCDSEFVAVRVGRLADARAQVRQLRSGN